MNLSGQLRCIKSLKVLFLLLHHDICRLNCGDEGDEQGLRFHKDISVIEPRCKGNVAMLDDYCCMMKICACDVEYHRRNKERQH